MTRKRLAMNSTVDMGENIDHQGAIVPVGGANSVANIVGKFDGGSSSDPLTTPQKNANKKKLKGVDGEAVDKSVSSMGDNSNISAASLEGDRRVQ